MTGLLSLLGLLTIVALSANAQFATTVKTISSQDTSSLGWDPDVFQFAGYVDVDQSQNSLFYWFFESRNDPDNDPVILFLNGGPGCSSLKGLLWVNGPGIIRSDMSHTYNPYSWNSNASVIWLDQPAGTGYSVVNDPVSTMDQLAKQTYQFLNVFFTEYPEYAHQDFHIAGMSDAGHYVGAIGAEILSHEDRRFDLDSLIVTNGLINTGLQYQYCQPMLCGQGGINQIVSDETCAQMDLDTPLCVQRIHDCISGSLDCDDANDFCNDVIIDKIPGNYFNLEQPCSTETQDCYPWDTWYAEYLSQPSVQQALGARTSSFVACSTNVSAAFTESGAQLSSVDGQLSLCLNAGIPVLLVAGDLDGTYNWIGNRAVAQSLDWKGQDAYNNATAMPITVNGKQIAEVTNHDLLTFVRVYGAGHLVSHDQPTATLDILNQWTSGNLALS